jgi:hypothetical protein
MKMRECKGGEQKGGGEEDKGGRGEETVEENFSEQHKNKSSDIKDSLIAKYPIS